MKLPELLLGTERLGSVLPQASSSASETETFRLLDEFLELGLRGFDLAASYQLGGTERLFGHWLSSRKNRERVYLVSKGGHPYPIVRPNRLHPADLTADLHDSLRRLRTEHIDLYLLHRDHPAANLEAIVRTLDEHRRAGKIGAWGVSNWHHDRILQLQNVAQRLAVPGVSVSSPQFSLAEWSSPPWKGCLSISGNAQRIAREFYQRTQLPVLAYSALGRGFFSETPEGRKESYLHVANEAKRSRAEALARNRGVTPAQIAIAYLKSQPFPVSPVVSARSASHLKLNLEAALELRLTEADLALLEGR